MQLINTDGMAFIGPGSEWFWTGLTGIVLAVTFLAIHRQLRLQAHTTAIEQVESFDRELNSELMTRHVVELLVALRDGKDPADLPRPAAMYVATFWEGFAVLTRAGHRDPKLLWRLDPTAAQVVWATLALWARNRRAELGDPALWEQLEWLAGVMAEMDRRAGRPQFDPDSIPLHIENAIANYQEQIRIAEAMRTVTVLQPVAVTVARPTAAALPEQ
jgi:hypothetical protein